MKKIFLIILMISLFVSCSIKKKKEIVITSSTKSFSDSLVPSKRMIRSGYVNYIVEIKGVVNDSVKFNLFDGNESSVFYLKGDIENKFMDEYSGCCPRYLIFDPYKATEGKLEIKYGLY